MFGTGYDGIVLCPAFIEAGRITVADRHLARIGDTYVAVGETEYARDSAFAYQSSNLREFIAERTGSKVRPEDVLSIGLDDIRTGGPDRVARILSRADGGRYFVANAAEQSDLDILALGIVTAQRAGGQLLLRTGPSLVRAVGGIPVADPLNAGQIWPHGRRLGHGAVFVGSHVGLSTAQLQTLLDRGLATPVELEVDRVLDSAARPDHVMMVASKALHALRSSDVVVFTSRAVEARAADESLGVGRVVSDALSGVARAVVAGAPSWVIAKGGITSHDIAVSGLGIRRAEVIGQLLPGQISVLRPVHAPPEVVGMPYVVFAGNVGDSSTLAQVVTIMNDGTR